MKPQLLFVFLFEFILFALAKKQPEVQKRFHFGKRVESHDIFFAPMIRKPWFGDPEYICGGTWISEKYALTTAYCLTYHSDIKFVGSLNENNRWDWEHRHGEYLWMITEKYLYNKDYDYEKNWFEHDIGIVYTTEKTYNPLRFFPKFYLDDWSDEFLDPNAIMDRPCAMFGFGRTEDGEYAQNLKYMEGKLHFGDEEYIHKKCSIKAVYEKQAMCFEPTGDSELLDNGDMGNPVYYDVKDPANLQNKDRVIVGIVSWYHESPRNIVLMNTTFYKDWIEKILVLG